MKPLNLAWSRVIIGPIPVNLDILTKLLKAFKSQFENFKIVEGYHEFVDWRWMEGSRFILDN